MRKMKSVFAGRDCVRLCVFVSLGVLSLSGCSDGGRDPSASTSQPFAIEFDDSSTGRRLRKELLASATVDDGGPGPADTAALIAGPQTRKICRSALGEAVSCQPRLLGTPFDGMPIIDFQDFPCDFVRPTDPEYEPSGGFMPKFLCLAKDEKGKTHVYKVKYRSEETFTEVAATRMLWSMGFAVDKMQPVRVTCRGCPTDPWALYENPEAFDAQTLNRESTVTFAYAAVEERFPAETIRLVDPEGAHVLDGFTYPEFLAEGRRNPALSSQQRARREALSFMNAFLYNLDTKSENQRLACVTAAPPPRRCEQAVALAHDVGYSFGGSLQSKKLDLEGWRDLPVWKDPSTCEASQHLALLGMEFGVAIRLSEAGLHEVQELFANLSHEDLVGIFSVARFGGAAITFPKAAALRDPISSAETVEQAWARAFAERVQHVNAVRTCPSRD